MEHFYSALLQWVQAHGLWGVFMFMAAENIGLPIPTAAGFVAAHGMVAAGLCSYWEAVAWVAAGHLAGSGVSYYLGRGGDSAVACYLSHKPGVTAVHEQMQRWYARYGPLAILFGRLVGHVRPWSSFVAGLACVPALSFWLWTCVGTVIFSVVSMWLTGVGYEYWQANRQYTVPIVVVMVLLFYGLPLYKGIEHLVRRSRRRRLAQAAAVEPCEVEHKTEP